MYCLINFTQLYIYNFVLFIILKQLLLKEKNPIAMVS